MSFCTKNLEARWRWQAVEEEIWMQSRNGRALEASRVSLTWAIFTAAAKPSFLFFQLLLLCLCS